MQLIDSDLKVTGAEETRDGLMVSFAFPGKAELCYFDGREVRNFTFESAAPEDAVVLPRFV